MNDDKLNDAMDSTAPYARRQPEPPPRPANKTEQNDGSDAFAALRHPKASAKKAQAAQTINDACAGMANAKAPLGQPQPRWTPKHTWGLLGSLAVLGLVIAGFVFIPRWALAPEETDTPVPAAPVAAPAAAPVAAPALAREPVLVDMTPCGNRVIVIQREGYKEVIAPNDCTVKTY